MLSIYKNTADAPLCERVHVINHIRSYLQFRNPFKTVGYSINGILHLRTTILSHYKFSVVGKIYVNGKKNKVSYSVLHIIYKIPITHLFKLKKYFNIKTKFMALIQYILLPSA